MKEQVIHLEAHDNTDSVRDKLGWIRAPRVLLVLPDDPRRPILQRKLDLVLIQREATRLRAQLALITRDPVIKEHAKELGIACFRTVEASHKTYWRTQRAQLTIERTEEVVPLDIELAEAGSRLIQDSEKRAAFQRITAMILLGIAIAGMFTGCVLIVPGATVTINPAANQVAVTTTVTASPEAVTVDTVNGIVPARVVGVEIESSATIETTGSIESPTEKARGVALFTNLIPDQVTIPAGTVVRTSAAQPVRFITLTDATLPGQIGETVEVPIEALEPGYAGNLPANRINQVEGALNGRVAVTNSQPTRGGEVTPVQAISQEDYDRVRALVIQQIQQRAYSDMQTNPYINLQETEFIPLESLSIVLIHAETYQGYIDQTSDQVSLTMRVTVQGIAVDERLARQIVYTRLAEKVGPGYQISEGSLLFKRGEVTGIDEAHRVTFVMQGTGEVSTMIQIDRIQNLVAGKTVNDATQALEQELPLISVPQIETWPRFWPLMPFLPLRIQIEIGN